MKFLIISVLSLFVVSCSFERSQFICDEGQQDAKDDEGRVCDKGVWTFVPANQRDMESTDQADAADTDATTYVDQGRDLADMTPMCSEDKMRCGDECVDISSDAKHCGACDKPCEKGVCSSSECVEACEEPTPELCGTTCVDTQTNVDFCGNCNTKCPLPDGASRTCEAKVCGFSCNENRADCDTLPGNGCEVDLTSDTQNCGGCGVVGVEICGDEIDNDCSGVVDDGPPEICDGIDNDCDEIIDEGCPSGITFGPNSFVGHQLFGSQDGGDEFSDDCGEGRALYRVNGRVEGNIDRMRGRCARLIFEADESVVPYTYKITRLGSLNLPYHGRILTNSFDIECPANTFAVGTTVEASDVVHELGLQCAELLITQKASGYEIEYGSISTIVAQGSNVGTAYTDTLVAPAVVRSIRGRSGALLDAFGIGENTIGLILKD